MRVLRFFRNRISDEAFHKWCIKTKQILQENGQDIPIQNIETDKMRTALVECGVNDQLLRGWYMMQGDGKLSTIALPFIIPNARQDRLDHIVEELNNISYFQIIDSGQQNALMWTIANGHKSEAIISIMSRAGNTADYELKTPLHLIVGKGRAHNDSVSDGYEQFRAFIWILKNFKDDINKVDTHGNTALHYACMKRDERFIKPLIDAGAQINIRNNDGYTPAEILNLDPKQRLTFISEPFRMYSIDTQSCINKVSSMKRRGNGDLILDETIDLPSHFFQKEIPKAISELCKKMEQKSPSQQRL